MIKIIKKQNNFGFTLTETIVVIAIFTLLALGVTTLFTHIFITSREKTFSLDNLDQARTIANNFTNEIRIASVGNDGAYPITQADDNEIIFYSNYKQADGIIARLHYYLAGNTLYKGTVIPSGSPLSYNLTQESIKMVQNNILNDGSPIFYYYDGDYTGSSSPLPQPVNVNQIKFIEINLDILKQATTTATTTFNVRAGSSVRNLKENLGN